MTDITELQHETLLEPVFIASNYMATDGRPLAELTAVSELKKDIEFDLRRCPYSGSRYEKNMNVSALPGLSQQIKNVISDTIYLRDAYLKFIGCTEFNLQNFWFFTRALDSLPVYLVKQKSSITKDNVPARVSAMFKAAQGLHLAPEVMLLDGADPDSAVCSDQLIQFIESRELFMDGDRACAGPPAMIKAFVNSAVLGSGKCDGGSFLEQLLGARGVRGLFIYADSVTRVFATKIVYEANCRNAVQKILESIPSEKLHSESRTRLSRFGAFRKRSTLAILRAMENFEAMSNMHLGNFPKVSLDNKPRLLKMLCLRNPHLDSATLTIAVDFFVEQIAINKFWMSAFNRGQEAVLRARAETAELPKFSQQDFADLGYIPAQILAEWLRISYVDSAEALRVTAGASEEIFSWRSTNSVRKIIGI